MSLTAAFQSARSSMNVASAQTALTSRNIGGAGDLNYTQKYAVISSTANGPALVSVERAADLALRRSSLEAASKSAAAVEAAEGYEAIDLAMSGSSPQRSLIGKLGAMQDALQTAATQPSNLSMADAALRAAKEVVVTLNDASKAIQDTRAQADVSVRQSVDNINRLLDDFSEIEKEVLRERGRGGDLTAALDRRDAVLSLLSAEIGISVVESPDGSSSIYASGGAVLFNRQPRAVTVGPAEQFAPGSPGKAVYVDGVNVTGETSSMRVASGRLAGAIEIRDRAAPLAQMQLDEVARGLIVAFAEEDVTGGGAPTMPGLFTYPGAGPIDPPLATTGLSSRIQINPSVDPAQGGSILRLRDGGVADPGNAAYVVNPSHAAGYSDRLLALSDAIQGIQQFDPIVGLGSSQGLLAFTQNAISYAAAQNQQASRTREQADALMDRMTLALSNATGVNVDNEMARLLDIENAYRASAKMISTVDNLYATLFEAVR